MSQSSLVVKDGGEAPEDELGAFPGGEGVSLVERLLHHKHDLGSLESRRRLRTRIAHWGWNAMPEVSEGPPRWSGPWDKGHTTAEIVISAKHVSLLTCVFSVYNFS